MFKVGDIIIYDGVRIEITRLDYYNNRRYYQFKRIGVAKFESIASVDYGLCNDGILLADVVDKRGYYDKVFIRKAKLKRVLCLREL